MMKMAGDAIVIALWRLNSYSALVARLLFDAAELEVSGVQPCKVRNGIQNLVYSRALRSNIFV